MKIPFFQVDAFTEKPFAGNPAAVCVLPSWPDTLLMQNIAAENNLSETAFLVQKTPGIHELRWFTPTVEIDLCGHATLACAFVLFNFFDRNRSRLTFLTASGELPVKQSGGLLAMDFPARPPVEAAPPAILAPALGAEPIQVLESRDLLAVFEKEETIQNMQPDFARLRNLQTHFAVIVTAPGTKTDFVSRFFAPNAGVDEDPVTGSAHCTLIPYWAKRLGKNKLHARQLSKRTGELFCEYTGDRVIIAGQAALFARGEILI